MDDSKGNNSELEKPLDSVDPPGQQGRRRVLRSIQATSFSGPLPPPALLREYEDVFSGCAERIVSMAEKQAPHRQVLEASALRGNQWSALRGQISGFLLGAFALWFGRDLILAGYDLAGAGVFLGGVASLVAVFIHWKKVQARELAEKRAEVDNNDQLELFPDSGEKTED